MTPLHIVYPGLPPSSNKLYIRGTILRREAREFKENFKAYVVTHYGHLLATLNPDGIYALHLIFYITDLVNKTYKDPSIKPSKRAETRYKRLDLSNRIKLLEDCLKVSVGIDDSRTFAASQEKHMVAFKEQEKVEIFLQEVEPACFGIPPLPHSHFGL